MKKINKGIALLILSMLVVSSVFAESSKEFNYKGEQIETINLLNLLTETRYRYEEVDSTGTRQIPYTEQECGYET